MTSSGVFEFLTCLGLDVVLCATHDEYLDHLKEIVRDIATGSPATFKSYWPKMMAFLDYTEAMLVQVAFFFKRISDLLIQVCLIPCLLDIVSIEYARLQYNVERSLSCVR